ncbi:MAG: SAM-dependent methyltransferase [Emcibacteraceae bacterium]|nr:SAM-dependent methyltransferase [Emcibacteraceae bacterium]
MTALKDHLINVIKLHGPIPISSYMTEVLTNPKYGYYVKENPFGSSGDFVTAPEVSQMFGELIGLWFADVWLKMGSPKKVNLIELGPGNGTFIKDFIRSINVLPNFLKAIDLHFVEVSPTLIDIQKKALAHIDNKKFWHSTVKNALTATKDDDGISTTFIIANEFFDALPIRQFQKTELGWNERMVTVSEKGDELVTMLSPFPVQGVTLPDHLINAELHSVIETSPMADFVTFEICRHFKDHRGAALFIDYGYDQHQTGETLQAVKKHNYVDVYDEPGAADLSVHVNFKKIEELAIESDLTSLGTTTQGQFLARMGIKERATSLIKGATTEQSNDIHSGLKRLISPEEMGTLFKVCGIVTDPDIEIAGF